ncbi:MAG: efflux RND transporter periplasmic adaptor subunit [Bacteroidaceae bacterium]|nr:efflux RND transporter periplasmic adaptor subunit [Bacteroidaceae bacterium]
MKRSMKSIALIAAVVGTALFVSCGKKQGAQNPQNAPVAYKTVKVKAEDRTIDTKYSATIRGRQDIQVLPQVSGQLTQLCVTEGQRVRKGQTLFIIDQVPYQAALNTARANLEAAKAAEATAKLSYESTQNLHAQQVVSDFDLQTANNAYMQAKAAVAQANAAVTNAANSLSYTVVKSPADGVVGTLPYRVGALVGPSLPTPLTTVSDNHQMYVYFSMTEAQLLEKIREAGSAEAAVKAMPAVRLQLVDGSEYDETGVVETASGVVDQSTGSVSLRAVFNNPSGLLHSGSTGNVVIPVELKNHIIVPAAAVKQLQTVHQVFKVVQKDGQRVAEGTNIEVAPYNTGKEFIVLSGLKEGDEIIADGAGMVKEGALVK